MIDKLTNSIYNRLTNTRIRDFLITSSGKIKEGIKMKLQTKLKKDGKQPQDKIKWAYYGYGILNCTGENTVKELPYEVKNAGFTKMNGETYCVDGAL